MYVAGQLGDFAAFWKNGEAQNLTGGIPYSDAYSIFVSGSDVYVAGYAYNINPNNNNIVDRVAKLWKNGVLQNLTDGTRSAIARSVFVVE
jgi:hypothetical protein